MDDNRCIKAVHFAELNVNHYYIYFRAAVMQLIFEVKLKSGASRKRGGKYEHKKRLYIGW